MANFLIRVELHEPLPAGVYVRLHAALQERGLVTVVESEDGSLYRLPTATYLYSGEFTAGAVRDWVQKIVDPVHANNWVLVTQYSTMAWKLQKAV